MVLNQNLFQQTYRSKQLTSLLSLSVSVVMVAALSGCAIGSNSIAKQQMLQLDQMSIGENFTKTPVSISTISQDWWRVWQDSQLNQLMKMLNDTSPSIQVVEARLDKALSLSDLSQTNKQIQGDISGRMMKDRYPDHYTYSDKYAGKTGSSGNVLVSLKWHLDFWGKWQALNQTSESNVNAAAFLIEDMRLGLQTTITRYYINWYFAAQLLQNQQQQADILKRFIEITELKIEVGLATQTDLLKDQLALSIFQQKIPETKRQILLYQHLISAVLGKTPQFGEALLTPQLILSTNAKVITPLPLNKLGQRPDIKAQCQHINALASNTQAARASFYPDIDLNAFAGFESLSLGHLLKSGSRTASIGPAISLPLFQQNRLRAELKGTIADYDEAVAQYNQHLLQVIQQTTDNLQQLQTLKQQNQLNAHAVSESQKLSDIQYQLVSKGLATQQQALRADLVKLEQQASLIQNNQQMIIAQIELTYSLGGYWAFSSHLKED